MSAVEQLLQLENLEATKNAESGLCRNQLKHLERLMRDKRAEFSSKLVTLNQQVTAKEDCSFTDAAEAASLKEEAVRANAIASEYQWTVDAIDGALVRLKQGRYGVSMETGEPISYERLEVIPWARCAVADRPESARGSD